MVALIAVAGVTLTVITTATALAIMTVAVTTDSASAPGRARMIPRTRRLASFFLGSGGWEKKF